MAGGLQALPQTFTYTEARRQGLSDRALYALRDQGSIEPIGRACTAGPIPVRRPTSTCWKSRTGHRRPPSA